MSVKFKNLIEAIETKKCVFCNNQMSPAPKLSTHNFGLNEYTLSYEHGPKSGNWHQISLRSNDTSYNYKAANATSLAASFVFECPIHNYTSDILAYSYGNEFSMFCSEEGVLFLDKDRVIFVWNLFTVKQTKILILSLKDLPDKYNRADFLTVAKLKNLSPINIDLVQIPSNQTKFFTKIKTYITFS